ncbi:hypothetical protein M5K25_000198 [Dendrobium thyrsiflorum]|uniref:NB-ARC domain-containing protein n=1 Tax=Dendrobium thyrsiflorum TaxID=117978 RepID=A0ABD0VTC6_DENTH
MKAGQDFPYPKKGNHPRLPTLYLFRSPFSPTSIVAAMAELFVGPIMNKIISASSDYLEDQVGWQTGMKEELERLREYHPKIQAVVHFASSQEQIRDQNPALNEWLDAIDKADDVLDDLDYMKLEKKLRSKLEAVVQKLDKISTGVASFLDLVKDAKQEHQEQQLELYRARETGSLPTNDLIGRGKEKEIVMNWLRNPSNEYQTTMYRNISLPCIVGHGGMGKTTLLQHVDKDEITEEFDLKIWVCVSNNFDVKKVIADMLESLKMNRPPLDSLDELQKTERPHLETLEALQARFRIAVRDIWEEEEANCDISKWENLLAPLADGKFGS